MSKPSGGTLLGNSASSKLPLRKPCSSGPGNIEGPNYHNKETNFKASGCATSANTTTMFPWKLT
eukprot:5756872-Amphidinium_carterae.1